MYNLLAKDTTFFDLFESVAAHAIRASEHLRQLAVDFPHISSGVQRICELEHRADDVAHDVLVRLDAAFITPLDREDIYALVGELDGIVDNIDDLAERFTLYHVGAMEPGFPGQCEVLVQITTALSDAVRLFGKSRRFVELRPKLVEVHRLEHVGDDNNDAAISRLFGGGHELLDIIRWKELYGYAEEAIDGCEDVATTLERIAMKDG